MKPVAKFLAFLPLLILVFGVLETSNVFACSGGQPLTIRGLINNSDFVVKAQPVDVDDVHQNGILRVESYLVGGPGPEYLLFIQNDPIMTQYILEGRSSGGDCTGFRSDLYPYNSLYLFLDRNFDGSYSVVTTLFNPYYYSFPTPESTVEVYIEGGGYEEGEVYGDDFAARDAGIEVTEIEFVQIVAEQSGVSPHLPLTASQYPLYAPLKITTSAGAEYLLPVDGQQPVQLTEEFRQETRWQEPMWSFGFSDAERCDAENCIQISPNGLDIAVQTDQDNITLTWGVTIPGQASLFSSTSDAIAVWNDSKIQVYRLRYPRLGYNELGPQLLTEVTLNYGDISDETSWLSGLGAWTPDGRILAYSDVEGLWLWDVFTVGAQRRLLLPTEDGYIPYPRYFSPMGRYLVLGHKNK
jgi:hypothetical protein